MWVWMDLIDVEVLVVDIVSSISRARRRTPLGN